MDSQQAIQSGYHHTGIYGRSREELAPRLAELKAQKYKYVLVPEKASGYERSAGVKKGMVLGYSVYVEKRYHDDRTRADLLKRLKEMPMRRVLAKKRYEHELYKLEQEEQKIKAGLLKLGING